MNNRLHVEAKQVIQKDKSSQIDLTTFNVERFMSSIDTDIVDSHGGTTELIRILNRLRAVASNDTHARYMEAIVEKRRSSGIKKNFTVTSVDNIDFL